MLTLQNNGCSCLTTDFAFTIIFPPSMFSLFSLFDCCVVFCIVIVVSHVILVVV